MSNLLKKSVDVLYDKKKKCGMFLSNFFEEKKLKGIKVQLQGRAVKSVYSVDVQLGTGGRHVEFSSHDRNEYVVPEYNDYSTITEEDLLETQFGEDEYTSQVANVADLITDRQELISESMRKSEEKQASDGLFNGQIVLTGGNKITFNKKETHTISKSAAKWTSDDNDPAADILAGCKLCVDDGKVATGVFHLILEDFGYGAMVKNAKFKANTNKNEGIDRTKLSIPEEKTPGGMFHGQFSVGSFIVNVWTYNERYMIPKGFGFANEGTEVGFIPKGCAIILPDKPKFRRYYGALNNVDGKAQSIVGRKLDLQQADQIPYAYEKVKGGSAFVEAGVKSRPLLVPADIDSFVTFKDLV